MKPTESNFRRLLESVPDAIVITDSRGLIAFVNSRAEVMFGHEQGELLGRPVEVLLPERIGETHAQLRRSYVVAPWTRPMGSCLDIAGRRKDGTEFPVAVSLSPSETEEGLYVIAAVRDITESKRVEKALQLKTDQLEAVVEAMERFLESGNFRDVSGRLLTSALRQTESEYGFIGVVVEGPVLRILAHEGVAWDAALNREFYEHALRAYRERGFLEFTNFNNLFGRVITGRSAVCSNDPGADPRSGGLPPGHPPLRAFLGIPVLHGTEVVGMIGVANRPGGYTGAEQGQIEILAKAAGVLYDGYRRREREAASAKERAQMVEALRRASDELELRVRERTKELDQTNLALQKEIAEREAVEGALKAALKEKDVLLREVYHRVKNNLQVIASLLSLQAASLKDQQAATMFRESQNRVKAMALVHEKLYQSQNLAQVDFNTYIQSLVTSLLRTYDFRAGVIAPNIQVENVSLSLDTAIPCGLLINELVSNALKHAFPHLRRPEDGTGEIAILFHPVEPGVFELVVRDNGVGMPADVDMAHPETFGLKLIATLAKQLRGAVELRRNGGTEMRILLREAGD
jgi:PAS domain S-box-containing protein